MAISEAALVGMVLILIRSVWGYAYSNETEIVRYVATMMPILAISNFMDGLQCVLSGTNFSLLFSSPPQLSERKRRSNHLIKSAPWLLVCIGLGYAHGCPTGLSPHHFILFFLFLLIDSENY